MGQGFAFPRTFGKVEDLPQTLARNNRALLSFLNESVVTKDADGNVHIDGDLTVDGSSPSGGGSSEEGPGESDVTVVGTDSDSSWDPSLTVPGGVQADDLLFVAWASRNSNPSTPTDDGTGSNTWDQVHSYDTSSNEWTKVWTKRADGDETTVDISGSGGGSSPGLGRWQSVGEIVSSCQTTTT